MNNYVPIRSNELDLHVLARKDLNDIHRMSKVPEQYQYHNYMCD